MAFEKRHWFYRDTVMDFSPAELMGTVAACIWGFKVTVFLFKWSVMLFM